MWRLCPLPDCADMTGRRLWYLVSLAGCVVFYICYQEWFSWIALVAVLGLPWLSLLLSLPGMLTFRIHIQAPAWVNLGEEAELGLAGSSRFPVPMFRGRLSLEQTLTGERWRYRRGGKVPAEHCGAIRVRPEKLRVLDYLGLFRIPAPKVGEMRILVRPRPVPLENMPDAERFLCRSWRPKSGGGYGENHEMRQYRPGDPLNQVHWKLTAKTGDLIIREPMEPVRERMLVTLDLKGLPDQLDRKLGQILYLGRFLLEKELPFEIRALTGDGITASSVATEADLIKAIDHLLCSAPAGTGSMLDREQTASWHCHIGGAGDET